jgi:ABC-type phosphate transport system auxiliary subunit
MSQLLTSDAFALSALQSHDTSPLSYDEGSMIGLDQQQQAREAFVRSRLSGGSTYSPYFTVTGTLSGGSSVVDTRSRIALLKKRIQIVREEKKRVLREGLAQVKSYRDQLEREHEIHAREMQELRNASAEINAHFIAEVEKLKLEYAQQKKPLDEIIRKVKSTITESDIMEGRSMSSIQVTEVKPQQEEEEEEETAR